MARTPKTAKRRSRFRRVLRWFIIGLGSLLGLVLLAVGAVLVLLHTDWGRAVAARAGLRALNDMVRGEVRVERLEGSVFGSFAVVGAEVRDPEGALVASAARIEVEWDPWALLGERVAIHRVRVVDPSFTLGDAEGRIAVARAFEPVSPPVSPPSTEPSAWAILVERAVIERGTFSMGPGQGELHVADLELDVAVSVVLAGDLVWEGLELSATIPPVGAVRVASSGRLGPAGLRIDAARVEAAGSRVVARGRVGTLDRPRGDVNIEARLDLDAVAAALPDVPLTGTMDVSGRLHGGYDGATLALRLDGAGGHATAQAWAALASGGMRWEASVQGRKLAPGRVMRGLDLPLVADVDVTARGKGGIPAGRASASVELLRLEGAPAPPLPLTLAATLDDGRARAHVRSAGKGVERVDVWADARIAEPRAGLEKGAPARVTPAAAAPLGGTVGWDVRGLDLRLIGALTGMPDLAGRVDVLSGVARAALPDGGAPSVSATVALTAHEVHAQGVDAERVQLRGAGSWAGGLPDAAVDVTVNGARGYDGAVSRVRASVRVAERGGEAHARGRVRVDDARWREAAVAHLTVPFEATSPLDARRLPVGRVAVSLQDARFEEHSIATLSTDQVLTHVGRSDRTTGPLRATGLRSGGMSLASVTGRVGARKGGVTGLVRIDAALAALGARLGPHERAARVGLDARVRLTPGRAGVAAEGTVEVQDLRAARLVQVAAARARFDAVVGRGNPVANATVQATGVALPERTLDSVDLRAALAADGRVSLAGSAQGGDVRLSVDATGALPRGPRDPIAVTLRELRLEGPEAGIASTGSATVRIDPGGDLEVRGLELAGLGELPGSIVVDGAWGPRRFDGRVDVRALPVARWVEAARHLTGLDTIALPGVEGTVTVEATTAGPPGAPTIYAKVGVEGGAVGGMDGVGANLEAWLEPGWAHVKGHAAWRGESRIELDVRVPFAVSAVPLAFTWVEDQPVSARVDLEDLSLADLRPWVPAPPSGAPLSGTMRARVNVAGPRSSPLGTISLTVLDVALGPLKKAELRGQITLDEAGTHGTVAAARGGKGLLRATLAAPVNLAWVAAHPDPARALADGLSERPFSLRLELDDLRLAELPYTEPLGRELRRVMVGADLALSGTLGEPRVEGRLRASDLPLGNGRGRAAVTLATEEEDLSVDLLLSTRTRRLLEGHVQLPRAVTGLLRGLDPMELLKDPLLLVWLASELDVPTLAELLPGVGVLLGNAVFDPQLLLTVVARGDPLGPTAHVVASLASAGKRVPPEQQGIARSVHVALELLPGGTHLSTVIDQGEGRGTLTAFGSIGIGSGDLISPGTIPADPALRGIVESRSFDLAGLSRLLPDVFGPSRGALTVDLTLGGTVGRPTLSGALEAFFEELSLAILGLNRSDAMLRIDIDSDAGRLVLTPIRWEDGGGSLDLELAMDVPALDTAVMRLQGKVDLQSFQVLRRGDVRAKLSGEVELAGTLAAPSVRGNVTVDDALIDPQVGSRSLRDIGPPEDVVYAAAWELEALRSATGGQPVQAPRNGLVLELGVTIPPRAAHLRSAMLDIFVEGDLQIQRFGGGTSIEGVVSVVEGSVELEGRRFVIAEDSRVIFGGGQSVDPLLQIIADFDIADVDLSPIGLSAEAGSRISVEVSGRASQPRVTLRSDPPMDETNIMSILLLGNPLGGGGAEATAALERGATGVFVGAATGRFTRLVQSALSIDVLRVEGGEQSLADAKVTVGKRITRDLLLMYHANLGAKEGENANEVRVDYRIYKGLHLETRFGDAGRGTLDLMYRWRY